MSALVKKTIKIVLLILLLTPFLFTANLKLELHRTNTHLLDMFEFISRESVLEKPVKPHLLNQLVANLEGSDWGSTMPGWLIAFRLMELSPDYDTSDLKDLINKMTLKLGGYDFYLAIRAITTNTPSYLYLLDDPVIACFRQLEYRYHADRYMSKFNVILEIGLPVFKPKCAIL